MEAPALARLRKNFGCLGTEMRHFDISSQERQSSAGRLARLSPGLGADFRVLWLCEQRAGRGAHGGRRAGGETTRGFGKLSDLVFVA